MANYSSLKSAVTSVIKTNGNKEITGAVLQSTLLAIINSLGDGFLFKGVATPFTNPGTPDQNVFYIGGAGTYTNFNSLEVPTGYLGVLKYNGVWAVSTVQVGAVPVNDLTTGGTTVPLSAEMGKTLKTYHDNNATAIQTVDGKVSQLEAKVGELKTFPNILGTYQYDMTDGSYVGNFEIPAGAKIKTLRFIATQDSDQAQRGIYIIRKSDLVCVYRQIIQFATGENIIPVGYTTEDVCYLGVLSLRLKYSNGGGVPDDSVFSIGLKTATPTFPSVGSAVTLTDNFSGKFALSVNIEYETGLKAEIDQNAEEIEKVNGAVEVLDTKIGFLETTPKLLDSYTYDIGSTSCVCDTILPANSILRKVVFFATEDAGQGTGQIFLIRKSDNVCVYRKDVSFVTGRNEIELNITVESDSYIGSRGLFIKYSSGVTIPSESAFSYGLNTVYPLAPTVGSTVTLTRKYTSSGNFALSLYFEYGEGLTEQVEKNTSDIKDIKTRFIGDIKTTPVLLQSYQNDLTDRSYVGDTVIPSGVIVQSVKFIANANSGQVPGVIYIIRESDNVCVYRKDVSFTSGENIIPINFQTETPCLLGVYNLHLKYSNGAIDDESVFSIGMNVATPSNPAVGTAVSLTDYYSGKYAVSVCMTYGSGIDVEFQSIQNDIEGLHSEIDEIKKGTIYPHGAIVSFIDDDAGKYVPTIWGEILQASPIRMGFACITGYMAGLETPPEIYEPMPLADLMNLYNAGHEVYSHSYSHPAFYSQSLTLENIAEQCYKSKDWLLSQGLFRGNDVIVYPGGMGENLTDRQAVVRQFYAWGVDTVGGGINPEPIKPWTVYRINADTATLDELKDAVDNAVSGNKLLVFMNHAYELNRDKDAQVAKMIAIIDYIKGTTAEITPLNEALHKIYGWWPI